MEEVSIIKIWPAPDRQFSTALRAALEKLPVLAGAKQYIPAAVEVLILNAVRDAATGLKPRGDKAAMRELTALMKHLKAAKDIMADMSHEASEAMYAASRTAFIKGAANQCLEIERQMLGQMEMLASMATMCLETKPVKAHAKRPRDFRSAAVARIGAGVYEVLTGTKAGVSTNFRTGERGGPFVRFLRDVFDALEIDGSPESQAKTAVKRHRKAITLAILKDVSNYLKWKAEKAL
jgi:hypothetical protein